MEVDGAVALATEAVATTDPVHRRSVADQLRRATFRRVLRGYDRAQVDKYVEQLIGTLETVDPGTRGGLTASNRRSIASGDGIPEPRP